MICKECKYSPKTYEEYRIAQSNPNIFCPDAYTEKASFCGNYDKLKECNDCETPYIMYEKDKIREVLKAIQSECEENVDYCKTCPFHISNSRYYYCLFMGKTPYEGETPDDWELEKIKWDQGGVHGQ